MIQISQSNRHIDVVKNLIKHFIKNENLHNYIKVYLDSGRFISIERKDISVYIFKTKNVLFNTIDVFEINDVENHSLDFINKL